MIEVIELACRSCGAKLTIHPDDDVLACGHCASQMLVQRRGGGVSLKDVEAAIGRVKVGTDKTAAELAIVRYKEELAALEAQRRAILATYRWSEAAYEAARAQVVERLRRGRWPIARKIRWGLASVVVFLVAWNWTTAGGGERGLWATAWLVLLGALSTAVIVLVMHVARQAARRSQEKQVAAVEAFEGRIARTRARMREKTQLADA